MALPVILVAAVVTRLEIMVVVVFTELALNINQVQFLSFQQPDLFLHQLTLSELAAAARSLCLE
jgi:hypothetical protein